MGKQPGDFDERPSESTAERADRNFGDLLQELRVTQTGVQILFAFLLTLAFQPRFTELDRFAIVVYVVTVLFCVAASIFLIAPVPLHRIMFSLGRKGEIVRVSARQAKTGLCLLGFAIVGATLLALDVALPRWLALVTSGAIALTLLIVWFVGPAHRVRRRADPERTTPADHPDRAQSGGTTN